MYNTPQGKYYEGLDLYSLEEGWGQPVEVDDIAKNFFDALDILEGTTKGSWDDFLDSFCSIGTILGFRMDINALKNPMEVSRE
jgi:hypothetical protein